MSFLTTKKQSDRYQKIKALKPYKVQIMKVNKKI